MPVQTMLSGKEIVGRRDEGVNNPECGTCSAKMKGNGTTKAGAGRGGALSQVRGGGGGALSQVRDASVRKHDNSAEELKGFLQ